MLLDEGLLNHYSTFVCCCNDLLAFGHGVLALVHSRVLEKDLVRTEKARLRLEDDADNEVKFADCINQLRSELDEKKE